MTSQGENPSALPVPLIHLYLFLFQPQERHPSGHSVMSHVVGHIDGIQLVSQESVPQMHALLLTTGVDGDDANVNHNHHTYDQVVFLQDHVSDQGDQVQGLLFGAVQLHHHHQQVGPGEHRTSGKRRNVISCQHLTGLGEKRDEERDR